MKAIKKYYYCGQEMTRNEYIMNLAANAKAIEAYNEAKDICSRYVNYTGDKRRLSYKMLQHAVIDMYMERMNAFAKRTNRPTYLETFYPQN